MKKIPELLAPVGGRKQLEAAVNNGADAVYVGGSLFNARMKADNFAEEDMAEAVKYAHERNVKLYVTVNTLIKDDELEKAFRYVNNLYAAGVDAVIIQDLGLARLVHKYIPEMQMHLSTQGTVYNRHGVGFVKKLGFSRIVPARELTGDELREFTRECHEGKGGFCSVEVFVHGALCMCYSGQCHMSRIMGKSGRSGNRGVCAQPCRLPYRDDKGREGYPLSPKDLCLLGRLPEICEMGVDSLKIEGRMKSPEYVAVVTSIYRKYLDIYSRDGDFDIDDKDMRKLRQIYSRGEFTEGYFNGNPREAIISGNSPKHKGLLIGGVSGIEEVKGNRRVKERRWLLDLQLHDGESINMGDGVELRSHDGKVVTGNVITYIKKLGKNAFKIGDFKEKPHLKDSVFKISDVELLEDVRKSSRVLRESYVNMHFEVRVGEVPVLRGNCGETEVVVTGEAPCEQAINKSVEEGKIKNSLAKLGGTPFVAGEIVVIADGIAALPVSTVNSMRRRLVEELLRKRCEINREPLTKKQLDEIKRDEKLGRAKIGACEGSLQDKRVAVENFEGTGIPYVLNVSKGNLDRYLEDDFDEVVKKVRDRGILIGNLGWIEQFMNAGVKVYGDYGLNVYNAQAKKLFEERGIEIAEYSHEIKNGEIPLMITEHPINSKYIIDRKGVKHKVAKAPSGDKYLVY